MATPKEATVRSRLSPDLKKQAESVLAAIGMSEVLDRFPLQQGVV